ncbi:MAG TPA: hypothetical protein VET66_04455 [Steroidobacteraceae bacterium]|nr:hypothetical protein [Steroidobacteraceae bacterium]
MPTFVSMITWSGASPPRPDAIRAEVDARFAEFRDAGLHSFVFLPEERACAAVMVASCPDRVAVERLAAAIYPPVPARVESMQFDDAETDAWSPGARLPARPEEYLSAVLEAVASA